MRLPCGAGMRRPLTGISPRHDIFERCWRAIGAASPHAANSADDSILPQLFVHCNTMTQLISHDFFCAWLAYLIGFICNQFGRTCDDGK
jgi:hypothetical protein